MHTANLVRDNKDTLTDNVIGDEERACENGKERRLGGKVESTIERFGLRVSDRDDELRI